jgi:hypothetical protein
MLTQVVHILTIRLQRIKKSEEQRFVTELLIRLLQTGTEIIMPKESVTISNNAGGDSITSFL